MIEGSTCVARSKDVQKIDSTKRVSPSFYDTLLQQIDRASYAITYHVLRQFLVCVLYSFLCSGCISTLGRSSTKKRIQSYSAAGISAEFISFDRLHHQHEKK